MIKFENIENKLLLPSFSCTISVLLFSNINSCLCTTNIHKIMKNKITNVQYDKYKVNLIGKTSSIM